MTSIISLECIDRLETTQLDFQEREVPESVTVIDEHIPVELGSLTITAVDCSAKGGCQLDCTEESGCKWWEDWRNC